MLLIPNAANAGYVRDAVAEVVAPGTEVVDAHTDMAIIAVQGPASAEVLADLGVDGQLDYMQVDRTTISPASRSSGAAPATPASGVTNCW